MAQSGQRMPRWSFEQVEILRTMYAAHSNLAIAEKIGRTARSVVSKAHELGLRKSKDRLQEMGRSNVSKRYEP